MSKISFSSLLLYIKKTLTSVKKTVLFSLRVKIDTKTSPLLNTLFILKFYNALLIVSLSATNTVSG